MPVNIVTGSIKYKDSNGEYQEITGLKGESSEVLDVQVDGTSILQDGVANVPIGGWTQLGVFKSNGDYGITKTNDGILRLVLPSSNEIKAGTNQFKTNLISQQHESTFYGLAKAAGSDMASSSNAVGTYTEEAKIAIQKMLGIYEAPWELIREDTFTNTTATIHEFSVDGNGQPFELTSAVLMFETPTQNADASANGLLVFSDGTRNIAGIYCGGWTQAANAIARGCWMVADRQNGLVFVNGKAPSSSTNMGNNLQSYMENFPYHQAQSIVESENFIVRLVKIGDVKGIGHYKLYGKRKWQ